MVNVNAWSPVVVNLHAKKQYNIMHITPPNHPPLPTHLSPPTSPHPPLPTHLSPPTSPHPRLPTHLSLPTSPTHSPPPTDFPQPTSPYPPPLPTSPYPLTSPYRLPSTHLPYPPLPIVCSSLGQVQQRGLSQRSLHLHVTPLHPH